MPSNNARLPNVNNVVLVGQLTKDPETREMPDGKTVCDLRLAVNDRTDHDPLFIDIATFGKQADACAQHLTKGRQIAVTGRLIQRQWDAKDGTKRSKHQIVGHVTFGHDGLSGGNHVPAGGQDPTGAQREE